MPATDANVEQLKVLAGFTVNKFAEDLGKPHILAVTSTGQMYVSDRQAGIVMLLLDNNGDGIAESKQLLLRSEETGIKNIKIAALKN